MAIETDPRKCCPFCHMMIATGDKEVVRTSEGVAHYIHALEQGLRELGKIKISKPSYCSSKEEMQRFLWRQAGVLFDRDSRRSRKRLEVVLRVAQDYFDFNIRISELAA